MKLTRRVRRLLVGAGLFVAVGLATGTVYWLQNGADDRKDPSTDQSPQDKTPEATSTSTTAPSQVEEPAAGLADRNVVVGNAVLTVPPEWAVLDLDVDPSLQCRLFSDGPALYIGTTPVDIDCAEPVPLDRPDPGIVARPASFEPFAAHVLAAGEPVVVGRLEGFRLDEDGILRFVFPQVDLFLVQVNRSPAPEEVDTVLSSLRPAALLDIAQYGHGFFTEGAFSFIEVSRGEGGPIAEGVFGPTEPIVLQIPVAEGPVKIRAFQRGCPGSCPSVENLSGLDPIGMECDSTFDLAVGELARVVIDGRRCQISRIEIPPTTPRRCLPDEVALSIETDDQPDGALAITTNVKNESAELCEVVLDEVNAAITDGAGHLLDIMDIEGNPISTSAGAAALFPGDTLQVVFDWRNSCGDYAAVVFQIDVTSLGSAETGIPHPKCDPGTDGTFALFPDSRIVERQTDGQQPDGTCRATSIQRVSYPYPTALEALAAELGALGSGSVFDEFTELLSGLTTDDFLATLRTDNAVTFRLLTNTLDHLSVRARRAGEGWGVDFVMSCTE